MRLRMYWALTGTAICRAFSTARTDAIACTVVHTPQNRWVIAQASRGSRPSRICSTPRHMVPEAQASVTLPLSTTQSMRRWPSMRVMGSMTMRLAMIALLRARSFAPARQYRQEPDREDECQDLERDQADRDCQLAQRGEVVPAGAGVIGDQISIDPVQHAGDRHPHR